MTVDFRTITIEDLQDIVIPFEWEVPFTGRSCRHWNMRHSLTEQ